MRGGGRTEFLHRQNDLILVSDVEFATFMATRDPAVVRAERFREPISVTLQRRYDRETARLLKQIRASRLAALRDRLKETA